MTADVDIGPIIVQAAIPLRPVDTPDTLAARVLRQEHRVFPLAVRWFLEGRLEIADGVVRVKGGDAQLVFDDS